MIHPRRLLVKSSSGAFSYHSQRPPSHNIPFQNPSPEHNAALTPSQNRFVRSSYSDSFSHVSYHEGEWIRLAAGFRAAGSQPAGFRAAGFQAARDLRADSDAQAADSQFHSQGADAQFHSPTARMWVTMGSPAQSQSRNH
jgi:hypothetical protein